MLYATVAFAAITGIASAKGGGGRGKGGHDAALSSGTSIPVTGNPNHVKTFKTFESKACRRDYNRLCPMTPIGKCDLQSKIEQLSPACKTFVETHRQKSAA